MKVPRRVWNLMSPPDQALYEPEDPPSEILIAQPAKLPKIEGKLKLREVQEQRTLNTWLNRRLAERKLWPINPRSDKASTIKCGHPDYTIFLPKGRVLLMEMKVEGGVFSLEQFNAIALLSELDHFVEIPRNADDGVKLVEKFL